ncbi:MAG: hypothetical protein ACRD3N_19595, partial [Terracidiphilus sp.]
YTHNYREFMGGFKDWVETIADSKNKLDYRNRVSDAETVSMWQSLSFGANYKAAYCLSVCPAGEEVIAPFLTDRKEFLQHVVKPLQEKVETVYVVPGSDAEDYVARRFPHKTIKRVSNGLAGQGTILTAFWNIQLRRLEQCAEDRVGISGNTIPADEVRPECNLKKEE